MDRSKFSNIVATTRLLTHFSAHNIKLIKSCIFEQLGCENESQFLIKTLQSICKNMSIESTSIIKNKAIEIADKQYINNDTNNSHVTVYKYVQQQYKDQLSRLHSDIIDYLGAFLSKKQSIEIGYLNKQLYIETQKQSYLTNRCNDPIFIIDDKRVSDLLWAHSKPFNYFFPRDLEISFEKKNNFPKLSYFNQFFRRLYNLSCINLFSLSYVPCHVLFDTRHSLCGTDDNIEKFKICGDVTQETVVHADLFCERFNKYKKGIRGIDDENNKKVNKMRCIKRFEVHIGATVSMKQELQNVTRKLLLTCGSISESICIRNGSLVIETMDQLKSIFHKNLKSIFLHNYTMSGINVTPATSVDQIGALQTIGMHVDNTWGIVGVLNRFDKFGMRKLVKHYKFEWRPLYSYFFANESRNDVLFGGINKILFDDYNMHPLLEKISIKFKVKDDLSAFARLLLHFNQHHQKLFVEQKLYLKYFKMIEIEFDGILHPFSNNNTFCKYIPSGGNNDRYTEDEKIFIQTTTKEYAIDKQLIQIRDVKQGIESFGNIYKNVFRWLQSIQKQSPTNANAITGCKVVFSI